MIYLDASESFGAYYLLQKREFYKLSTKTSLSFKLRLSEHNPVGLYNLLNVTHSGSLTSIKFAHALVNALYKEHWSKISLLNVAIILGLSKTRKFLLQTLIPVFGQSTRKNESNDC